MHKVKNSPVWITFASVCKKSRARRICFRTDLRRSTGNDLLGNILRNSRKVMANGGWTTAWFFTLLLIIGNSSSTCRTSEAPTCLVRMVFKCFITESSPESASDVPILRTTCRCSLCWTLDWVKRFRQQTYTKSRQSQTVEYAPYPSFPTTWYCDLKTSPICTG